MKAARQEPVEPSLETTRTLGRSGRSLGAPPEPRGETRGRRPARKKPGRTGRRDRPSARPAPRRKQLRVLTRTYTGSTEAKALDQLCALGAEVRVAYDTTSTRLHAKAWHFHRDSGFTTAYIGSSNLTHSAQVDGLEWNVRVSGARNPTIIVDEFCVSVDHARFMARVFNQAGIRSGAICGTTPDSERKGALSHLARGEVNVVFSVGLFNEGIDVPTVDTLFLLRSTDSATLFLQQLGRGLRRHESKGACLVLDFVGQHRREFPNNFRRQVEELRVQGDVSLATFLEQRGLELEDVYASKRSWSELRE